MVQEGGADRAGPRQRHQAEVDRIHGGCHGLGRIANACRNPNRGLDPRLFEDMARRRGDLGLHHHAPGWPDRSPVAGRVEQLRRPRPRGGEHRTGGQQPAVDPDAHHRIAVELQCRGAALADQRTALLGQRRVGVGGGAGHHRVADIGQAGPQLRTHGGLETLQLLAGEQLGSDGWEGRSDPALLLTHDLGVSGDEEHPRRLSTEGEAT